MTSSSSSPAANEDTRGRGASVCASLAVVGVVAAVAGAVALAGGASNAFGVVFALGVFVAVFFGVLFLVMRAARANDQQAVAAVRASSTPGEARPDSPRPFDLPSNMSVRVA